MPKANVKIVKESSWNLNKPGGWETYKPALEEAAEELEKVVDDAQLSEEEVMTKFDAVVKKVKFKAFGKSKPRTEKAEARGLEVRLKAAQGLDSEENVNTLMRKQYEAIEDDINRLKEGKLGRLTNVFKMKKNCWL